MNKDYDKGVEGRKIADLLIWRMGLEHDQLAVPVLWHKLKGLGVSLVAFDEWVAKASHYDYQAARREYLAWVDERPPPRGLWSRVLGFCGFAP